MRRQTGARGLGPVPRSCLWRLCPAYLEGVWYGIGALPGYRSVPEAAIEPWKWPDHREPAKDDQGFEIQARCYQAFFEVFWDQPWFAGAYFWKWFPRLDGDEPRRVIGFTPQDKPAERVLGSWYGISAE